MERNVDAQVYAEIAELYDAIYHLTKVVKVLTKRIIENNDSIQQLCENIEYLPINLGVQ